MNERTYRDFRLSEDQRIRAIRSIADMIEYRNLRITKISEEIRQGIRILHRERTARKHEKQVKILTGMADRLYLLINDNEYDVSHLQIFLTHAQVKQTCMKVSSTHDLHYFQ
jgi:hypothetical protein